MSRILVLLPTDDKEAENAAYRRFEVADIDKAHAGPPGRLRIVRSALYAAGAVGTLIAATGGAAIFLARALKVAAERNAVRKVIDGDRAAPSGLDPETIAAVRRIARHLRRLDHR